VISTLNLASFQSKTRGKRRTSVYHALMGAASASGPGETQDNGAGWSEDWQQRLSQIDALMRDMSTQSDPQLMVKQYGQRMRSLYRNDGIVSLSKRGLETPKFRITRFSGWSEDIDPWKQPHKLPVLDRGILGELLYTGKPLLINDLRVDESDPCAMYLNGFGSMLAIPHYESGEALNMVCVMRRERHAFETHRVPELVWLSSLFGRATSNLVLSKKLAESNEALDREMRAVADIQRALLPVKLPSVPGLDLATHYQTSKNAGGDYYDFFELQGGRVGMLIADVSGHGTPAAVLMAIMHAIAHVAPTDRQAPGKFLAAVNRELSTRYALTTSGGMMFVTAFYAVYNPATRTLDYASAGHNPPRLRVGFSSGETSGPVLSVDSAQGVPLGILEDAEYPSATLKIDPGDALILYTDGITETFSPTREMFGTDRLDEIIARPHEDAAALLTTLLDELGAFAHNAPAADDRTVIVATAS